jgi:RNA polymerase sigma-70 factor, ECF subfamily
MDRLQRTVMKEGEIDDPAASRKRFDEACAELRPDLHRFCTRMVGGPSDGEDVLQDALALAFYRLPELRAAESLRSWLFRIAHNKCIDVLRGRRRFEPLEDQEIEEERRMDDDLDEQRRVERTLSNMVTELPPKERACIVLKDILDCSLEETAAITGSNVGAVKTALHRARTKLEAAEHDAPRNLALEPARREVIAQYIAAFNRQDWDGVRALLTADARLEVVRRIERPFAGSSYFENYRNMVARWRFELAWIEGVESVVQFREEGGAWRPHSVLELSVDGDRVSAIRDYVHVDYLLRHCEVTQRRGA